MALRRVDTTAPKLETTIDNAKVSSRACRQAVTGNVPQLTVDWTNGIVGNNAYLDRGSSSVTPRPGQGHHRKLPLHGQFTGGCLR